MTRPSAARAPRVSPWKSDPPLIARPRSAGSERDTGRGDGAEAGALERAWLEGAAMRFSVIGQGEQVLRVVHLERVEVVEVANLLADREAELLPVPYFHVVYTLPSPPAAGWSANVTATCSSPVTP